MQTLLQILNLLPAIITTVRAVETALPAPSAGNAKLNMVLGLLQTTGEVADGLLPEIAKAVGVIVTAFNAAGIFQSAPTAPQN